jgi:hypothetical protein
MGLFKFMENEMSEVRLFAKDVRSDYLNICLEIDKAGGVVTEKIIKMLEDLHDKLLSKESGIEAELKPPVDTTTSTDPSKAATIVAQNLEPPVQ